MGHRCRWQAVDAPPPCQNLKSWSCSIEASNIHQNDIFVHIISFFATFSGPPSKLVPHFPVHAYTSASSVHVYTPSKSFCFFSRCFSILSIAGEIYCIHFETFYVSGI